MRNPMGNYAIALSLAVPSLLAVDCMIGPGIEPPGPEILPPEATMPTLSIAPIKRFELSWAPAPGASFYQLLVSPTVDDPFVSIGVALGEELSLSVPLHLRHQARYMLRACNQGGCTDSDPLIVTGSLAEAVGYFKAASVGTQDYFGASVAVSGDGNTLAVGAYGEDGNASGIDGDPTNDLVFASGAVYVFTRDALGQWSQQAYVKAGNPDPNDYFGFRLALSDDGDTLAVSAHDEDGSASGVGGRPDDALANAGAVYVFTRSASEEWSQQAYVKASNPDAGDGFGRALALSGDGNTLAVGSAEDSSATGIDGNQDDDSAPGAGAVYVGCSRSGPRGRTPTRSASAATRKATRWPRPGPPMCSRAARRASGPSGPTSSPPTPTWATASVSTSRSATTATPSPWVRAASAAMPPASAASKPTTPWRGPAPCTSTDSEEELPS